MNPRHDSTGCIWVLVRSGCMTCHTFWRLFAHMHVFVRLSVPVFSVTLWLFIKALLPGNLVAWQHEWGSPKGRLQPGRNRKENRRKEKGQDILAPPLAFHLLVFSFFTLFLSLSGNAFLQFGSILKQVAITPWNTLWNPSQAGKVLMTFCLWPAAQYHSANC